MRSAEGLLKARGFYESALRDLDRQRPALSAWARTTASMAIAIRVTDHSTVSCESPRQGQKSGGIPPGNRPAIQRTVVMIREPVVRIQPGRHASRLGTTC